jgi:glycosyltransferase involved in cell wall biosynthesis
LALEGPLVSFVKVVYIISDIDKALAFEWIAQELDHPKFELNFILLNPGSSVLESFLRQKKIPVTTITCRGKKDWLSAVIKTVRVLKQQRPDVVHCHLLQANIIGLFAAKLAGIKKRIYTRHHSSYHHVYYKKGVLWDKWSNHMATHVVAISGMVKEILTGWEKVPLKKIVLIPHGFRLEEFENVEQVRVEQIKAKYQVQNFSPVIGVISRFTKLKGVQYIIPAFKQLLSSFPDAVLLLLGVDGDYKKEIGRRLESLPEKNIRLVSFEKDVAAAYHAMDIFVHVPIDEHSEAFGQIYVEALAAGVPSIFTLSGIAPDFIVDEKNALAVPFKNSEAIYEAMMRILQDENLRNRLKQEAYFSVEEKFALSRMIHRLEKLYEN